MDSKKKENLSVLFFKFNFYLQGDIKPLSKFTDFGHTQKVYSKQVIKYFYKYFSNYWFRKYKIPIICIKLKTI